MTVEREKIDVWERKKRSNSVQKELIDRSPVSSQKFEKSREKKNIAEKRSCKRLNSKNKSSTFNRKSITYSWKCPQLFPNSLWNVQIAKPKVLVRYWKITIWYYIFRESNNPTIMPLFHKKTKSSSPTNGVSFNGNELHQHQPQHQPQMVPSPIKQNLPPPSLVFHCQLANGSPTGLITGFSSVKELYQV